MYNRRDELKGCIEFCWLFWAEWVFVNVSDCVVWTGLDSIKGGGDIQQHSSYTNRVVKCPPMYFLFLSLSTIANPYAMQNQVINC
jgi:hypothetical protein